jgi:hypothetical protein
LRQNGCQKNLMPLSVQLSSLRSHSQYINQRIDTVKLRFM